MWAASGVTGVRRPGATRVVWSDGWLNGAMATGSGEDLTPDFNRPQQPRRFTQARPRPVAVWVLFLILFVQGVAVLWTTVGSVVAGEAEVLDAVGQIMLIGLYVAVGILLIVLGFRLFLGHPGARTPTVLAQFMIVVLSFSFFAGGAPLVGMLFLVPAATALLLAFIRPTQKWLDQDSGLPEDSAGA